MPKRYTRRRRSKRTRRMPLMRSLRRYGISAPEKKYFEFWFNPQTGQRLTTPVSYDGITSMAGAALGTGWRPVSLFKGIPVGFSDGQRVGNEILARYIQLAVYVTNFPRLAAADAEDAATLAGSGMICRYNMQRIRNNNGQNSVGFNWMQEFTPTGTGPNIFNVGSFKYTSHLRTHKTLLDAQHQAHTFATNGDNISASGTRVIQHFIKLNRRVRYTLDYSSDPDLRVNDNLAGTDVLFAACANMNACCAMQVRVRICYQDN